MNLSRPHRRPARESIVPMINVVFLLLIFFLMTASLEPSPPFDLALPQADTPAADRGARALYISPVGDLAFDGQTGPHVLAILSETKGPVTLHADASSPANLMSQVLSDLSALGIDQVNLATTGTGP